jgi:hypothetical protein
MNNNFLIGDAFQDGIIIQVNPKEGVLIISAKEDFQQDFWLDENGLNRPFYKHSVYGLGVDKSWRFPEIEELAVMYELKLVIGGFKEEFYWSSSLAKDIVSYEEKMFNEYDGSWNRHILHFGNGNKETRVKTGQAQLRLVKEIKFK